MQVEPGAFHDTDLVMMPGGEMAELAARYAQADRRLSLSDVWREGLTRAQKLSASLASRLPGGWPESLRAPFLSKVGMTLSAAWDVYGPPA